jgi:hypothetical protein
MRSAGSLGAGCGELIDFAALASQAKQRRCRTDRKHRAMTETRISSATAEVVIGFERRFVMIGERINPTGRQSARGWTPAGADLRP